MNSVVDLHSHILPELDDGSSSVEESIAMLQMEAEQGIQCVVATPHFYPQSDNLEQFLERRARSERILREEMAGHSGLPKLYVGAEVGFFTGISRSDEIADLAIGSSNCILIEMPHTKWTDRMYQELEAFPETRGLTPIIAHVDRYLSPFRTKSLLQRLSQLPVLVQVNASFFEQNPSKAIRLFRDGWFHLLGSDCHNLRSRKPNLAAAVDLIEKQLGAEALSQINRCEQELFCKTHTFV